jgi:WD40 repeat protein
MRFLAYIFLGCLLAGRDHGDEIAFKEHGWIGALAFSSEDSALFSTSSEGTARMRRLDGGIGTIFKGHKDCVVALDVGPKDELLATGSFDQTARLWRVGTAQTIFELEGHRGGVMTVTFSPDGKLLATGGIDGTIRLWNTTDGKATHILKGHKSWVNCVRFSGDGKSIVSGSSDGTIKFWSPQSGSLQKNIDATPSEVRSIAISTDGRELAAGIRYGTLRTWFNDAEKLNFKAHESDIWAVAFSPGRQALISADGDWNKPGLVKLWDSATGKALGTFNHPSEVLSIACSHDGNRLAIGGWDGSIKIQDLPRRIP